MPDLYHFIRPMLFQLDAERAHQLTIALLRLWQGRGRPNLSVPSHWQTIFNGWQLPHPIGLAAGFDKDAEAIPALFALGFSMVEVGTVTPLPQPGNPKPRAFRLPEVGGVINRYGFNSQGLDYFVKNLRAYRDRFGSRQGILGANLGKNKTSDDAIADYVKGAAATAPYVDYLTLNISSPNTPGLRAWQGADGLRQLVQAVQNTLHQHAKAPKLFVKVAPDQTPETIAGIVETLLANPVDGLIVGNTTLERSGVDPRWAQEAGGLSGEPLFTLSTRTQQAFAQLLNGRIPIIGVGGISTPAQLGAKLAAGAGVVQLYTALIYQGPGLVHHLLNTPPTHSRADNHATQN